MSTADPDSQTKQLTVNQTFGWEPCRRLFAEPNLWELMNEHYAELGVTDLVGPPDPDFERFIRLEAMGLFFAWAARDSGKLIGYVCWFVQPHLAHKGVLHAVDCGYFLSKRYRLGATGHRMFKTTLDALEEMGVRVVMLHHKLHFRNERDKDQGRFFRRLGFRHTDQLYMKALK